MKKVVIIVPKGHFNLASLQGPYDMLSKANRYLQSIGQPPAFAIQLAGISTETELETGIFSIRPAIQIKDVHKADLVIIPALSYDFPQSLKQNEAYLPWLTDMYKNGAAIASICTGAFLLAATGLLNGKKAATHWMVADVFRKMFPEVKLMPEKIITDEHNIYTSGGAYTFLHFMLYLLEKYCGHDTAVYCAKIFEVDLDRNSQSPFTIFTGQKDHTDEIIKKAQLFMENNITEKLSSDQLAAMFALSRRSFDRRFKKATSNSPSEYLQRLKIEAAKKILESERDNVNDVMYRVGYGDRKAFRTIFKKITGLSPLQYRNKYNRVILPATRTAS